jgi:hypothetical protein
MEAVVWLAHARMDAFNGFNELEMEAMRAVIVMNTVLHRVLPLFDMVYTYRVGELWYFDEDGKLSHTLGCRKGVRQGCALGVIIFRVIMAPVYNIL